MREAEIMKETNKNGNPKGDIGCPMGAFHFCGDLISTSNQIQYPMEVERPTSNAEHRTSNGYDS